uniref:Uncharacterized protein n=1 Tax=Anopheles darlingi TaxID=43151 RepID=A0A2M4D4F5_ANODA
MRLMVLLLLLLIRIIHIVPCMLGMHLMMMAAVVMIFFQTVATSGRCVDTLLLLCKLLQLLAFLLVAQSLLVFLIAGRSVIAITIGYSSFERSRRFSFLLLCFLRL